MNHLLLVLGATAILLAGCSNHTSAPVTTTGGSVPITVTAAAKGVGPAVSLENPPGTQVSFGMAESLKVDWALIILKDIRLVSDIDKAHMRDSSELEVDDGGEGGGGGDHPGDRGHGDDGHEGDHDGHGVHLKGPFFVTLMDKHPVQVAVDSIPPGTYNGIMFVIHKLRRLDVMRNPSLPDSLVGLSVVVSGSVKDSGGSWMPFLFKTNINEEFKVKGNFVVMPGDKLIPFVLDFDLTAWFEGRGGQLLDPNNSADFQKIRQAIRSALKGGMRGGRDDDDDGEPD